MLYVIFTSDNICIVLFGSFPHKNIFCLEFPVLQPSKKPLPPDAYVPSTNGVQTGARRSSLKDTSRNSSTKSEHRTVRIQDDFKDSKFRHETLVERRIKAATPAKPANIRVKILHDFEPSDNEELQVREGQFVKIIYQKNDWLYVVDSLENEGFIPFSYCSTFNTSTNSKSSTSGCDEDNYEDGILEDSFERLTIEKLDIKSEKRRHSKSPSRTRNKLKTSPVTYFPKRAYGPQMTVLYDYEAGDENDVNVRRGDFVMLLNDQDPDWFWVMTGRGEEGFIPRAFVMAHTCEGRHSLCLLLYIRISSCSYSCEIEARNLILKAFLAL